MPDNSFLIDTSAWLFALKRDFVPEVKNRIDLLLKNSAVVTTGIINLEIISGARTKKEFQRLKDRFNALDLIESDESIWQKACELGFNLRRKGVTVPHTDILIATCALQSGSIIVHADAHFDMMAKHAVIKVESFVQIVRKFRNPL
jgi:predicted nucleic acid-binding protein